MKDVEQTIIDAAIKLFSEKGYAATSIRDISKEVDMKSASLYHYIESKNDLLDLIMTRYLKELINGAKQTLNNLSDDRPEIALRNLIKFHVESHGKEKLAALVVDTEYRSLGGASKEEIRQLRKDYENLWQDILEKGRKKGVFQFSDIKITSFALIGLCTGVAHWYQDGGRLDLNEIAEQYATLGLNMVQPAQIVIEQ